jgi:hypothetical protein
MNPCDVMLLHEVEEGTAIRFTHGIPISGQMGGIQFMSKSLSKSMNEIPFGNGQRARNQAKREFAHGSASRFHIFRPKRNNHERHIPQSAQQPGNIHRTLLRAIGTA